MSAETPPLSAAWMEDLDARYRAALGLRDRRDYSIFYSQVRPWPVLILGMNPGGDPATWTTDDVASTGWYEDSEHEYVDMDYPLALAMRRYLVDAFGPASPEAIRPFPKTNLAFRRSSSIDTVTVSIRNAVAEAAPFVTEIIAAVDAELIILEGTQTARWFAELHTRTWMAEPGSPVITTPNGRHRATIFRVFSCTLVNGDSATALAIGHPSRYSGRQEWRDVIAASTAVVNNLSKGSVA